MKNSIPDHTTVFSVENLLKSWESFRRGKTNKPEVADFAMHTFSSLADLSAQLLSGAYRHGTYQRFIIHDPKYRIIHKATVGDRIVHHAVYAALYDYFDRKFIFDVYSCRVGKGLHRALNRYRDFARRVSNKNQRQCYTLKCDIRKCFDTVDHHVLKQILARRIADPKLLAVLNEIIDSFRINSQPCGLPLGNVTSQLLINIYLNELDQFIKHKLRAKYYIRYVDDFVILDADAEKLGWYQERITLFLESRLIMNLHQDKIFIQTINAGTDFLGWVNYLDYRVIRPKTRRRITKNLSQNNLSSIVGLLNFGNSYNLIIQLLYNI
ncbi:RNA-directed DNA polymerase [Candidatus Saccharibacteria bacterium]|nr:RNA-directed DNA polymerase [Candidatus Saccharibacteria bacterium]